MKKINLMMWQGLVLSVLALGFASCEPSDKPCPNKRLEGGETETPPASVVEEWDSNTPGVEIIFEVDDVGDGSTLRAGSPNALLGLEGSGKDVELSLASFYSWDYLKLHEKELKFSVGAKHDIYVKELGYRIFDPDNASHNIVNTSFDINKLQMQEGFSNVAEGLIIKMPESLDETKHYSLRLRLSGGDWKDPNTNVEDYDAFPPIRERYSGNFSAPRLFPILDHIKEQNGVFQRAMNNGFKGFEDDIEAINSRFYAPLYRWTVSETYEFFTDDFMYFFQKHNGGNELVYSLWNDTSVKQEIESKAKEYMKYWEYAEDGDDDTIDDYCAYFVDKYDYGYSNAIYDVLVKGKRISQILPCLHRARALLFVDAADTKLAYLISRKTREMQKYLAEGTVKGIVGRDDVYCKPFTYKYQRGRQGLPINDELLLKMWNAANDALSKYREQYIDFYNRTNELLPSKMKMDFHEKTEEGRRFFDLRYNYIKIANIDYDEE